MKAPSEEISIKSNPNPTLSPRVFYTYILYTFITGEKRLHTTEAERWLDKLKLLVN